MGNTKVVAGNHNHKRDHPHLRGEYSGGAWYDSTVEGSPPPTWGIHLKVRPALDIGGITPTYVGNTVIVRKNKKIE